MKGLFLSLCYLLVCTHAMWAQNKPIKVGDKAPEFEGIDQNGKKRVLSAMLKDQTVVLIFYRGHWCPYCNKQLKHLEDSLQSIKDKGAILIAVSPEQPEYIRKTIEKTGASYPILYDHDLSIMQAYKVAFTVQDDVLNRYKNAGIDLAETNGGIGNTLPVPAIYIIGKNGLVSYEYFDPNYRKRASVQDILRHL